MRWQVLLLRLAMLCSIMMHLGRGLMQMVLQVWR
jgi:hypothetical protein